MRSSHSRSVRFLLALTSAIFCASFCSAQFTANIQGVVEDASGAGVSKATIELVNTATGVKATATADAAGNYRFLSLAPGNYKVTGQAAGFAKAEVDITLLTDQNLTVPITLKVGLTSESVTVTTEAPLVNTSETRNQLTLETQELSEIPMAGRTMISLITTAPGVSGRGVIEPTGPGTAPGGGLDNYNTEVTVDASANGQGGVANLWIIDGLDATSGIRQGVLNLSPNPDVVQETAIQVNTFAADYGHSSSVQFAITTKSGADQFHGLGSDYFTYQNWWAKDSLPGSAQKYAPFHANSFSGTIGGPIIPHHQFFFFFGVEPLRSSLSTGNTAIFFPDNAFENFAATSPALMNTFGTKILNTYKFNATGPAVKFASDIFPSTCGTPTTDNLPCDTAMIDQGVFNSTNFRNAEQYFVRIDKYFQKDRVYGSFFDTILHYGGPAPVEQFATTNHNVQRSLQINETHTFNPSTLNEANLSVNRIEGFQNETGDFTIPTINVTGSNGYGLGFAQGDFIQHNYRWRDVLSHVHGAHVLKVGYEGWYGDDVEPFQGPWSMPTFDFSNLLALAQDSPNTEGGVMYSPTTGQQQLWSWNAASKTFGFFAQDTWKARRNLTLTLGLRFEDQGNPYSKSASTIFGNFHLGSGSTLQEQVANGASKASQNALNQSPKAYNPRLGVAWDVNGKGDWMVRGGFGMFTNWLTPANIQEEFRGDTPGLFEPTFFGGSSTPPIFLQGTSNKPPFGFTFPTIPGCPCLNAQGGIPGANENIGAINPNIVSPTAYIFAATLERRLGEHIVASVLYSGSHTANAVPGGNNINATSFGTDINAVPGVLIGTPVNTTPTRSNPGFGAISYTDNNRVGNYNGITFDVRGRSKRAFFDASYTRSSSKDDAGVYPSAFNPHQFYGPSPWDIPNRFSLSFNYQLPGIRNGSKAIEALAGGWAISGTSIYQSGNAITPFTDASYWNGGDFNADGDNLDYPNVTNYHQGTSRSAYLTGIFSPGQFTAPTPGTEGNEKPGQFRNPGYARTDLTAYKDTHLSERFVFQLRFEFFNAFNHVNFNNVATDIGNINSPNSNFGQVTFQEIPRFWQLGGKIFF
jgi:hypothetical protein